MGRLIHVKLNIKHYRHINDYAYDNDNKKNDENHDDKNYNKDHDSL